MTVNGTIGLDFPQVIAFIPLFGWLFSFIWRVFGKSNQIKKPAHS
jgi:hypothetical protein